MRVRAALGHAVGGGRCARVRAGTARARVKNFSTIAVRVGFVAVHASELEPAQTARMRD